MKKGKWEIRPNNILGVRDWKEAKEFFAVALREVKRQKSIYAKCDMLNFFMWLGIGKLLTKRDFELVLQKVGLTYEVFKKYVDFSKNIRCKNGKKLHPNPANLIQFKWFYELGDD